MLHIFFFFLFLGPLIVISVIMRGSHRQLSHILSLGEAPNRPLAIAHRPPPINSMFPIPYCHKQNLQTVLILALLTTFNLASISQKLLFDLVLYVFLAFSIPVSRIKWKLVASANFRLRLFVDTYFWAKSWLYEYAYACHAPCGIQTDNAPLHLSWQAHYFGRHSPIF